MAVNETIEHLNIQKNSKILVNVDEILPDIIIVTYNFDSKIFQGALLDSTKKSLPFGVATLHPAFTSETKSAGNTENDDKLYSTSQRFTYQEKPGTASQRRPVKNNNRHKNSKMTVRLRPRQVLCSKCRGICNENSENVDHTRKRKNVENSSTVHHEINTRLQAKEKKLNDNSLSSPPRPLFSDNQTNNQNNSTRKNPHRTLYSNKKNGFAQVMCQNETSSTSPSSSPPRLLFTDTRKPNSDPLMYPTLIPRISRLNPNDIKNAMNGNRINLDKIEEEVDPLAITTDPLAFNNNDDCGEESYEAIDENQEGSIPIAECVRRAQKRMVLRKKKSVGSMEDLWDESVFEENNGNIDASQPKTLKISFGPQGEGTIVKIPAKIETFTDDKVLDSTKAARRALKKAKKEARKKILISGQSPCYTITSPRYTLTSPRYTLGGNSSPRYSVGAGSPRYNMSVTLDSNAPLLQRRHKHKVKHKKKRRRHTPISGHAHLAATSPSSPAHSQSYTTIKENCLKQKLSISLKRLNENSYKCDSEDKSVSSSDKPYTYLVENSGSDSGSSTDEAPPNFPASITPDFISADGENDTKNEGNYRCTEDLKNGSDGNEQIVMDSDGNRLKVGHVVWGKVHGFPWWPGKVLSITKNGSQAQAHVAWYGSSTSSLMPCNQLSPFLENFKTRYNKKKRGSYKEAIRQATSEAQSEIVSGSTPIASVVVPLVSPPLASPREIDVAS